MLPVTQGGAPAPYDTNIPGAPGYMQAELMAKTAYQNALTRINSRRQDTLRQYGYQAQIDPTTGVLGSMSVDPNNPYGGFQQLLKTGAEGANAAVDDAVGRHLGHGGLAAQGLSRSKYDFGQASSDLGQRLTGTLAGLQDDQSSAAYQRDQALYQAQLDALRQAILDGMFNPADFSGIDWGGDGGGDGGGGADPGMDPISYAAEIQHGVDRALGARPWQAALDARGAGMNARYGLGAAAHGGAVIDPIARAVAQAKASAPRSVVSIQPQTKTPAAKQPIKKKK